MLTITDEQRHIIRHALGLTRGAREYRNHFVTGPGSTDYPHCEALVAAGLMTRRAGNELSGGDAIYSVTVAGRAALGCTYPHCDCDGPGDDGSCGKAKMNETPNEKGNRPA